MTQKITKLTATPKEAFEGPTTIWIERNISAVKNATLEQRWRSGEGTRLPPMWPGFDFQTRCHTWVEFVGSLLCNERFFSAVGTLVFLSPQKPTNNLILS